MTTAANRRIDPVGTFDQTLPIGHWFDRTHEKTKGMTERSNPVAGSLTDGLYLAAQRPGPRPGCHQALTLDGPYPTEEAMGAAIVEPCPSERVVQVRGGFIRDVATLPASWPVCPIYAATVVDLSTIDSGSGAIVGAVVEALEADGHTREEVDAFRTDAYAGDYSRLLRTVMLYVTVTMGDEE